MQEAKRLHGERFINLSCVHPCYHASYINQFNHKVYKGNSQRAQGILALRAFFVLIVDFLCAPCG